MSASAPDWTQQRDDTDLPVFFRVVNAILRFINVVFSAVFFPLYTSLQRLQTETKSEFPRGFWFGVRRFFAALFALSLLAGYVVMFVLVVEALAGPSTLARSVSAVSSVIAIAYGLAIIESSSMRRIFRCFSSPIRYGPLLVSILDALCDLVASAGCVVVCMCVLRVRYLVRALSQALTDENPRPYKYRFQYIVLCEVGMTCVDVVVCPFACALLLFPWRTAEAFRKIRAMQSQRHARAMVFIQLMRGLGDLPFIIMSTVVIVTMYRAPAMFHELWFANSIDEWNKIIWRHVSKTLRDIPCIVLAVFVMCSWRSFALIRDVRSVPDARDRRHEEMKNI